MGGGSEKCHVLFEWPLKDVTFIKLAAKSIKKVHQRFQNVNYVSSLLDLYFQCLFRVGKALTMLPKGSIMKFWC